MHKKLISALLASAISVSMAMTAFAAIGYGTDMDDNDDYVPPVQYPGTSSSSNPSVNNNTTTGGSTTTTPAPGTSTVTTQQVVNSLSQAISNAKDAGTDSKAEIVVKNVSTISAETLKAAAEAAKQEGVKANIMVDKTDTTGAIVARVYIDPEKAANLTQDINLDVNLETKETAVVAETFKTFFNVEAAVINLGQKGEFGIDVPMAVKVDLSKLDVTKLQFMSYDLATNTFKVIANPQYFVDANGYLHFTTPIGNNIVITDQAL